MPDIGELLVAALPKLFRFALALAGRRDVADDLVQRACEKALVNAASWTPGSNFDAWMFRILRNAWIDDLRHNKVQGVREDVYEREDLVGVRGDAEIESRLTLRRVWLMIGELPQDQKEVLLLACVEGLSYKEIAETLEIPLGTVMSRLARARAKISARTGIEGPVNR